MDVYAYPRGPLGRVMAGIETFLLLVGVDMVVKWLTLLNFRCRSASARRKKVAAVLPYGFSWIILDKHVRERVNVCVCMRVCVCVCVCVNEYVQHQNYPISTITPSQTRDYKRENI